MTGPWPERWNDPDADPVADLNAMFFARPAVLSLPDRAPPGPRDLRGSTSPLALLYDPKDPLP